MEVTINTLSDIQQEAEFVLTAEELQPHFERAYKKAAPNIEVRGFRKGKVPLDLIKKLYGEAIEQEALDDIANDSFREAMTERNIEPIGRPEMVDMDFRRGEHFRFKVQYEVTPTFELKPYKGLAVEKPVHRVSDEEVQAEVQRLRRINANLLGVTLVRDNDNHVITADVQELADDGMPLIGKKSQDVQFELADQNLVPELRDVLARAEVGGRYRVRFSTQHGDHTHQYHIEVTVKRIEKVELPEFNDEFVRKITGDSEMTAEKFLARMREDIQAFWDRESDRLLDQAIINELVRMHQFNVPASLVNAYLDSMLEEVRERARNQKRPAQIDEERFRNENRGYATYQAKWEILRRRIIEAEGITVSDEDIERAAARDAQLLGLEKDRVAMYYRQSQSGQERILTEKLMKVLKDHARITERVVDNREES